MGSSAGIFGLLGALIALGVRDKSSYGAALRSHYLQWGIYAMILSALFPQTDNAAHIGGVAGGFAIAYIAGTPRLTGYGERLWHFAGAAAVGLTAVAFAFMFRWMMTAETSRPASQPLLRRDFRTGGILDRLPVSVGLFLIHREVTAFIFDTAFYSWDWSRSWYRNPGWLPGLRTRSPRHVPWRMPAFP